MENNASRNTGNLPKVFVNFLLLFNLLILSSPSFSDSKFEVSWAGVSIDESSIPNAPVAVSLLENLNQKPLDVQARKRIREKPFENISFLMDRDDSTEGVILTAAVLRENLQIMKEHNRLTPVYKHNYRIFINLMAFDWDVDGALGRYIGSVPLVIDYLAVSDAPHTKQEQVNIFKSMYLDNSLEGGLNVFDKLYQYSRNLSVMGDLDKFPQISSVEFTSEAAPQFNLDINEWSFMAKQFFEAELVKSSKSVLVPSMSEDRMNKEFRLVFADKSQEIIMPEPEGEIKILVEKLIPIKEIDGVQASYCHIAVIRIKIIDELDEEILSKNFARVEDSCFVTHKDNQIDSSQKFNESMLILLRKIAEQFGDNIDQAWLKEIGVEPSVMPEYIRQITLVKEELLQPY